MPHATSIHSQHATCKCVAHCERQRDISSILTFDGNLYGTFYAPFVVVCPQWIYLQKKVKKKDIHMMASVANTCIVFMQICHQSIHEFPEGNASDIRQMHHHSLGGILVALYSLFNKSNNGEQVRVGKFWSKNVLWGPRILFVCTSACLFGKCQLY